MVTRWRSTERPPAGEGLHSRGGGTADLVAPAARRRPPKPLGPPTAKVTAEGPHPIWGHALHDQPMRPRRGAPAFPKAAPPKPYPSSPTQRLVAASAPQLPRPGSAGGGSPQPPRPGSAGGGSPQPPRPGSAGGGPCQSIRSASAASQTRPASAGSGAARPPSRDARRAAWAEVHVTAIAAPDLEQACVTLPASAATPSTTGAPTVPMRSGGVHSRHHHASAAEHAAAPRNVASQLADAEPQQDAEHPLDAWLERIYQNASRRGSHGMSPRLQTSLPRPAPATAPGRALGVWRGAVGPMAAAANSSNLLRAQILSTPPPVSRLPACGEKGGWCWQPMCHTVR